MPMLYFLVISLVAEYHLPFFFATFLYGSHFSQNRLGKKKEMVIMGRVSPCSGLPEGEATPESCLKIQIP